MGLLPLRRVAILVSVGIVAALGIWHFATGSPTITRGVLRIGFEHVPPVQIRTDSGPAGMAVEAVSEAAKRAGLRLQWIETGTSSEEALRRGLVDLWPLMIDLPERRKRLHLTQPWLYTSHVILLRSDRTSPDKEFSGRIAVFKIPIHVRLLREAFPKAVIVAVPESRQVIKEVCQGSVVAGFLEGRAALSDLSERPPECGAVTLRVQNLPDLVTPLGIGSTVRAAGAADQLRSEIGRMFRDGTLAATLAKYSYGLEDTWATYHLMGAADQARWITWGVGLMSIVVALIVWQAASLRQRRRSEAELRESEERFRNMADTAPVMIWVTGPDKRFTFVNKTWLEFTGRTMDQELGNGWAVGLHPDDRQRCYDTFSSAFDAHRSFHLECRLRREDGEYRTILCRGIPRFAPGGNFAGYIGSDIDITDLQSEERFRQLAENIDQVFWMLDIGTKRMLYVSPAFEKVWGRSPAALYEDRDSLLDSVDPEDRDRVTAFLTRMKSESSEESYRIIRPDGSVRWIYDRSFLVYDPEGKPYRVAGIVEDVTAHRELEEALRQAHKMEAIGRLAGGIAHDFNNLLTIVSGYLHLVLDETHPADPRHGRLKQILTASNRASTLTSQLLAFGRKQMLQPRLVNVNNLLTNMEALLRPVMGEHIRLETDLGSDLLCVKADPNQLEQVLMNLAANARDAMPEGGAFRIRTTLVDGRIDSGRDTGPCVCIQVSDTGCGMSQNVLEHVFEPFFTTKGVGKGTGLGLSTVYGIIQQNHGTIRVSSSPGRGTTFDILLRAETEGEEVKPAASPLGSLRGTETILVAEDEAAVRKLVCETLEELGYTVLQAADGREALRILEKHGPIHLLLTDVMMPVMGGAELARRVRSMAPGTKIVYISGYTDDTLAFYGLPQPDTEYVQKPFSPATLAEKLRHVLATARGAVN